MTKVKILIVEDEVVIAEDLKEILEDQDYSVCNIAYSYDQAASCLSRESIDLVFLDIALKGVGTGLDVADLINKKYKLPFIFLTSFGDKSTIAEVISKNPSGYIAKPFKENDIAPAVEIAIAKGMNSKAGKFPLLKDINAHYKCHLTLQESKVLQLIWDGHNNASIAMELFVSINTVKTHITKIYSKLQINSRTAAINKIINI